MMKKNLKVLVLITVFAVFISLLNSCTPEPLEENNEISLSDKDEEPDEKPDA